MPHQMSTKTMWTPPISTRTILCLPILFLCGCNLSSNDGFTTIEEKDIKVATVDETQLNKPDVETSSTTANKIELTSDTLPISIKPEKKVKEEGKKSAIDEQREIKLLIKEKTFQTVGPEGAIRVSYDDIDLLKVLNMEKAIPEALEYFPDWLKNLDGQRIRIRGFMYTLKSKRISNFMLTRDTDTCCFGPTAKIYDRFPVTLRKGHRSDYIFNRPFDVVGVFKIKPWIEENDGEDEILELYHIEDAVIIQ